jgi:hypothetical protein
MSTPLALRCMGGLLKKCGEPEAGRLEGLYAHDMTVSLCRRDRATA